MGLQGSPIYPRWLDEQELPIRVLGLLNVRLNTLSNRTSHKITFVDLVGVTDGLHRVPKVLTHSYAGLVVVFFHRQFPFDILLR